jgi:putative DNA primase/helicase
MPVVGSEDSIAHAFAQLHADKYRWTPGMGWMTRTTDRWVRDDRLTAFDVTRQLARLDADCEQKASVRRSIASSKSVAGALVFAKSDPVLSLPMSAWDAEPLEINTPGGIVDLRTGGRRAHGPADFVTQCTAVGPGRARDCKVWLRFLDEVFVGDQSMVEFMQRLIGYSLTADRSEQKVFFMHGLGANGKSTLWDFIAWLVGSYTLKLPAHVLMHSQLQGHPTELAQLRGKRLAISSEIEEGQYWAESRIKELTGDERLSARFMRQDYFEFVMTQKHVIVGNYKPRLKGGDAALARRFVLVPFLAKFAGRARDAQMHQKLKAEACHVLAWAIDGAVKWEESGLEIPPAVEAASADYMGDNDDLALWLEDRCVLSLDAKAPAARLYADFLGWLKARGQHAPSMRLWADRMATLQGVLKQRSTGGVRVYRGIGLRAEDAGEPPCQVPE